jgi:hypothetical protein
MKSPERQSAGEHIAVIPAERMASHESWIYLSSPERMAQAHADD